MASVQFVTAVALMINGKAMVDCPRTVNINCERVEVQGTGWLVPETANMVHVGYAISLESAKPSPDSVRFVRIYDRMSETTYLIALPDGDDEAAFIEKCNACCGDTPVMDTVTIPPPMQEECPCADDSGNYTYLFPFPENTNDLNFLLTGYFNGAVASGVPDAAGYATSAAVLTFAQTVTTGWLGYGTWSVVTNGDHKVLKLVSTTVLCADVRITILPAKYCLNVSASKIVDGIKIGGVNVPFPGGVVTFDNTTMSVIAFALKDILVGTAPLDVSENSAYLEYTGLQVPGALTLDGDDVAGAAFAAGECAETFNFAIPALEGADHLEFQTPLFDGVAPGDDLAGEPYADAAAILAAAEATWGDYGTWSLTGGDTNLRLVSPTLETATLTIADVAD